MRLSDEKRAVIIHLHKQGKSNKKIAMEVKCSMKGVAGTINRWKTTGSTDDQKGRGRKRISSTREDRTLVRLSLSDRKRTSTDLRREWKDSTGVEASSSVVRRRLLENGLRGCKAKRKPLLSEKQRKARLAWAKTHRSWTAEQWAKVLFSDESTFTLQNHAGNNFVRRRPGEEFNPQCILPTVKHPMSVMVWGCMSAAGVGRLKVVEGMMNANKYIEVLTGVMLPSAREMFTGNWTFQDDNAPCHRAKKVKEWATSQQVDFLNWPAQSPDLNPIENLWQKIGLEISKRKPTNKRELIEKIIEAWYRVVTPEDTKKLVESMPRRCRAVIANKGWPTKY